MAGLHIHDVPSKIVGWAIAAGGDRCGKNNHAMRRFVRPLHFLVGHDNLDNRDLGRALLESRGRLSEGEYGSVRGFHEPELFAGNAMLSERFAKLAFQFRHEIGTDLLLTDIDERIDVNLLERICAGIRRRRLSKGGGGASGKTKHQDHEPQSQQYGTWVTSHRHRPHYSSLLSWRWECQSSRTLLLDERDKIVLADALQHQKRSRNAAVIGHQVRAAGLCSVGLPGPQAHVLLGLAQKYPQIPTENIKGVLHIVVVVPGHLLSGRNLQFGDAKAGPRSVLGSALDFIEIARVFHCLHGSSGRRISSPPSGAARRLRRMFLRGTAATELAHRACMKNYLCAD